MAPFGLVTQTVSVAVEEITVMVMREVRKKVVLPDCNKRWTRDGKNYGACDIQASCRPNCIKWRT